MKKNDSWKTDDRCGCAVGKAVVPPQSAIQSKNSKVKSKRIF